MNVPVIDIGGIHVKIFATGQKEHREFESGPKRTLAMWGVELRKVLAQRIVPEFESKTAPKLKHDSSTNNLIRRYQQLTGAK